MSAGASTDRNRVVVVGGGLAGLAAATLSARAGAEVTLLEKSSRVGGRAESQGVKEFVFNEGAHALYVGGPACEVLRDLGVAWKGADPRLAGAFALEGTTRHRLPVGLGSFATTSLLPPRAKVEAARWVARLGRVDAGAIDGVTLDAWLEQVLASPRARAFVRMFVRLTSFDAASSRMSAGAAVRQFRRSTKGVRYLDGGWQTLVDGLRAAAEATGVRILTGAGAARIEHGAAVAGVRLEDGTRIAADAVIVASSPRTLDRLLDHAVESPARWAESLRPVRAACLDVALERLPDPRSPLALGFDAPTYVSVHSASARLAPEGGALVCAMKYLGEGSADGAQAELEAMVDALQPGWRDHVVHARMLPLMVASHAAADASTGGLRGRPRSERIGVRGLFAAGDWVGPHGMLLDAAMASARAAAALAAPEARRASAG
jgi:phytoene dehydrogenase-like protein